MEKDIQNPGSALGEAIGADMEVALNTYLTSLSDAAGCYYINKGLKNTKTGKHKKLLMYDNYATAYNIDGVITNESFQPLILVECKYIRYKKHNRDKGSWICAAHPALRRRYHSIRSSIAVLAGNWSKTSLAMMKSHDINYFLVPFSIICALLREFGVDFDWDEKDREAAVKAWLKYSSLSSSQKEHIGQKMVGLIADHLSSLVTKVLDEKAQRQISKVVLEVYTNIGEIRTFDCTSFEEAIEMLKRIDCDKIFDVKGAIKLFDPPPPMQISEGEPEDENNNEEAS
jgi:hypothetical protein